MGPELSRLAELLPRPAAPERSWDWEAIEAELRTALPRDYRELVEAYGGGALEGYLLLLEPGCPHDVYDLAKISAEREEANDSLWQYGGKPAEMESEGNRLICWGTTDNGEYLFWLAQPGDDPDRRPTLINDASGDEWERYDMTVTQFLTAVLTGEIRSEILWDRFPLPLHKFVPAREI